MQSNPTSSRLVGFRLLERFLRVWVFLAISVLLIVWALPHTIAARNIALFTGASAGIGWMLLSRPSLTWKAYWPSICLLLIPLWVLFHWYFISTLKVVQWQELSSTWLRAGTAVVLGSVVGIMLSLQPRRILWVVFLIVLLPMITFVLYLNQAYLQHTWFILPLFFGAFKAKYAAVYFVVCQVMVGFGLINFAIASASLRTRTLVLGIALVLIGTWDFIALRAVNGVLITGLGLTLTLLFFFYRSLILSSEQHWGLAVRVKALTFGILVALIISLGLYAYWGSDRQREGKLSHLLGDIQIAVQVDKTQTWVNDGRSTQLPVDATGRPIHGSTYERISWFIKGVQIIQANPLGNGISHMAFGYYMRDQYPNSRVLMTHSAWIDYALGLGLPGLLLAWMAIGMAVIRSLYLQNQLDTMTYSGAVHQAFFRGWIVYIAPWLLLGMCCFWFVGEVNEREYLEHYFFLIALFGIAVSDVAPKRRPLK